MMPSATRNAECANALGDDPLVGGADGPEIDAGLTQSGEERGQLGEDAGAYKLVEIVRGGGAQFLFAQAGVDLHHLTADHEFADVALAVGAMACVDPVAGGARNQTLLERPEHEAQARISTPQGSIAIEHGNLGIAFEDQPFKLRGGPLGDFYMRRCQSFLNHARKFVPFSLSFKSG